MKDHPIDHDRKEHTPERDPDREEEPGNLDKAMRVPAIDTISAPTTGTY